MFHSYFIKNSILNRFPSLFIKYKFECHCCTYREFRYPISLKSKLTFENNSYKIHLKAIYCDSCINFEAFTILYICYHIFHKVICRQLKYSFLQVFLFDTKGNTDNGKKLKYQIKLHPMLFRTYNVARSILYT